MTLVRPTHSEILTANTMTFADLWENKAPLPYMAGMFGVSEDSLIRCAMEMGLCTRRSIKRTTSLESFHTDSELATRVGTAPAVQRRYARFSPMDPDILSRIPGRFDCKWIDGEGEDTVYCLKHVARPGCSYCEEHARIAFTNFSPVAEFQAEDPSQS